MIQYSQNFLLSNKRRTWKCCNCSTLKVKFAYLICQRCCQMSLLSGGLGENNDLCLLEAASTKAGSDCSKKTRNKTTKERTNKHTHNGSWICCSICLSDLVAFQCYEYKEKQEQRNTWGLFFKMENMFFCVSPRTSKSPLTHRNTWQQCTFTNTWWTPSGGQWLLQTGSTAMYRHHQEDLESDFNTYLIECFHSTY